MNFKIDEENGKFVVKVQKEEIVKKPFWKFWGPTSRTVWEVARKKDGSPCIYDKVHHARGFIQLTGGNISINSI